MRLRNLLFKEVFWIGMFFIWVFVTFNLLFRGYHVELMLLFVFLIIFFLIKSMIATWRELTKNKWVRKAEEENEK